MLLSQTQVAILTNWMEKVYRNRIVWLTFKTIFRHDENAY
mgnify:CR=1 FL=1